MAESVRRINEADIPELAETFTQAFFDDPLFRWWIPVDGRRKELLPGFFTLIAQAYLPSDEIDHAGEGVAAALWAPPGGGPTEAELEQLAPRLGEQMAEEHADTLFEILEVADAKHPTDPHYYLFMLGTRPPFQSRGLGSQLLRTVLDSVRRRRGPRLPGGQQRGQQAAVPEARVRGGRGDDDPRFAAALVHVAQPGVSAPNRPAAEAAGKVRPRSEERVGCPWVRYAGSAEAACAGGRGDLGPGVLRGTRSSAGFAPDEGRRLRRPLAGKTTGDALAPSEWAEDPNKGHVVVK